MPPSVVMRRVPRVISGPGIGGREGAPQDQDDSPAVEERAVAGDDGPRRSRFRFASFLRRGREDSAGEHH
jgi:hypothetical protein